jgi:hypothetical protein
MVHFACDVTLVHPFRDLCLCYPVKGCSSVLKGGEFTGLQDLEILISYRLPERKPNNLRGRESATFCGGMCFPNSESASNGLEIIVVSAAM